MRGYFWTAAGWKHHFCYGVERTISWIRENRDRMMLLVRDSYMSLNHTCMMLQERKRAWRKETCSCCRPIIVTLLPFLGIQFRSHLLLLPRSSNSSPSGPEPFEVLRSPWKPDQEVRCLEVRARLQVSNILIRSASLELQTAKRVKPVPEISFDHLISADEVIGRRERLSNESWKHFLISDAPRIVLPRNVNTNKKIGRV